ncbi:Golgi transport complex subunit 3 [Phlyctochytrium bullatum]|nr:Golgi transport complex subunit 3 [Phlyctochytrium bullatum]
MSATLGKSTPPKPANSPQPRSLATSPQPKPVVAPRPAIDFTDWDLKMSALLTDEQKRSVLEMSELCKDEVPWPYDLFPEGETAPSESKKTDAVPPLTTADSRLAAPAPAAESAASPFRLSEPITSTQQFLKWFASIESAMEHAQEDVYRTHVAMLEAYLSGCNEILMLVADVEGILGSQTTHYEFVSSRTSSLKEACENLLREQEDMVRLAEEIRERLKVFDLLEPAVKMLTVGGDGICAQPGFFEILASLDGALEFCASHLSYRDAELYLMKFRQCMTRGLTLIKMHFVAEMRNLMSDILQRISDRQQNAAAAEVLPKALQTSFFYIKFKAQVKTLKPMLMEIEKRCEGHREYLGLLGECSGSFFAVRKALLGPIILTEISNMAEGKDMLALARVGAEYILNVCTDECALYSQFFSLGQDDFSRYLESLCSALYDHLRPLILREQSINVLTELCRTLKQHLDSVDALAPPDEAYPLDPSFTLLPAPVGDAADAPPVSPTSDADAAWRTTDFDVAAAKVAVEKILQDAQERLVFRAQGFIQTEIGAFKPTERELEILARTDKLPQPNLVAQPNMVPDLDKSQPSALLSPEVPLSPESFTDPSPFAKIVYGSGEWFPTLQKTLYILGKMYKALPSAIFEDLSQEALSLCLKSLLSAADVIQKKFSKIDGQFFLIKNLMMLREQISPFDSNFTRREEFLDFSNMQEAFNAILKSGWDFSKLASIGIGLVSSGLPVVPRVVSTFQDSRRAVSDELRKVCEAMILETSRGAVEPVASFMIKATAFRLKQEKDSRSRLGGSAHVERLGMQGFASPQNCVAVSESLKTSVPEKVRLSAKKMREYLGDPSTESVLTYHIKTNIVETYTVFYNTVTKEHDHRVLEGFMSIKDVSALVDAAAADGLWNASTEDILTTTAVNPVTPANDIETMKYKVTLRAWLLLSVIIIFTLGFTTVTLWTSTHSHEQLFKSAKENADALYKDVRVVASISSFGHRLDRIAEPLESLYKQTRRPDVLYLHVPKELKRLKIDDPMRPIVAELEKKYEGWLKVTRPETDYGPSTKLLGTLLIEKNPNTIVVTVDDDEVYHEDMILALVDAAERDRNVAPCFICEKWPWWSFKPMYAGKGTCHGWGNAFAGVAYRVGFFDEGVFNYTNAPSGCRLHDDVYLSGYMRSRGHRPYVIKPGFEPIRWGLGHTNLSIHNVPAGESDYRDPCIRFFDYLS